MSKQLRRDKFISSNKDTRISHASLVHNQELRHITAATDHDEDEACQRIHLAEKSFALREFRVALDHANQILKGQSSSQSSLLTNFTFDNTDVKNSQHAFIYDVRLSDLCDREDSTMSSLQDDNGMFSTGISIHLKENGLSSIIERASAIAIQSCYELWKERGTASIDDEVGLDLAPFLAKFRTSSGGHHDFPITLHPLMTVELSVLYIHFCHAIGLYHTALISSLDVLSALIDTEYKSSKNAVVVDRSLDDLLRQDQDDEEEGDSNEGRFSSRDDDDDPHGILYNHCSELLHLILVKTLPRLKEIRMVESITDAIFTLVKNSRDEDNGKTIHELCRMWNIEKMKISPLPERLSMEIILRNMEGIIASEERTLPPYLRESMQDTLLDLKDLLAELDQKQLIPQVERSYDTEVAQISRRTVGENAKDGKEHQAGGSKHGNNEGRIGNLVDDVVNYFWESEDRWLNRGKAVAVGVLSYSVWKRRRRICGRARSAGSIMMTPVHEILNAITSAK